MHIRKWLARPSTTRLSSLDVVECQNQHRSVLFDLQKRWQTIDAVARESSKLAKDLGRPSSEDSAAISLSIDPKHSQNPSACRHRPRRHGHRDEHHAKPPSPTLVIPRNIEEETWRLADSLQEKEKETGALPIRRALRDFFARDIAISQTGPSAEKVWSILLGHVATNSPNSKITRRQLFNYAARLHRATGQVYNGLYRGFIGDLLQNAPNMAKIWTYHIKFKDQRMCSSEDLLGVIPSVLDSKMPVTAFNQWKRLYLDSNTTRELSIACLSKVPDRHSLRCAFEEFLLQADNHSSQSHSVQADRRQDADTNTSSLSSTKSSTHQGSHYVRESPAAQSRFTRAGMSAMLGHVHGITDKSFGDTFAARMLATRMLPLKARITGLRVFGVDKIGSTAIQEIARQAGDPQQIDLVLKHAKAQGLDLVDCTYLRLLRRSIDEPATDILQTLLESDQHPDNFDDISLQTRLLEHFEDARDWPMIRLTVKALSIHNVAPDRSWLNILLRAHLASRDLANVETTVEQMRVNHVAVSERSLRLAKQILLPWRAPTKKEVHEVHSTSHRVLLASIYSQCLDQDCRVTSSDWIELFKRFGMAHQITDMNRLLLWLGGRYAEQRSTPPDSRGRGELPPFEKIFNPNMQKAIVRWAWIAAGTRDDLQPQSISGPKSWTAGIATMRQLHQFGLPISESSVKEAIILQLWILNGPAQSSRASNARLLENNNISIRQYLRRINDIWPGLMPTASAEDDRALLIGLFGQEMKTRKEFGGQVDVASWAISQSASRAKHVTTRQIEARRNQRRSLAWQSTFKREQAALASSFYVNATAN